MRTTLRWLAAITLLAFIVTNPLIIGGLSLVVYLFGRALSSKSAPVRYACISIMTIAGVLFAQLVALVFPPGILGILFVAALIIVAAKSHSSKQPKPSVDNTSYDDAIEVEVISVTTVEHN